MKSLQMHPLFLTITKSTAEGFTGTLFFSVRSSIMNLYVHTSDCSNYKTSLQNPSFLKIIKPNLCVPVCCRLLSWWVHHRPAQRLRTQRCMGFFFSFLIFLRGMHSRGIDPIELFLRKNTCQYIYISGKAENESKR